MALCRDFPSDKLAKPFSFWSIDQTIVLSHLKWLKRSGPQNSPVSSVPVSWDVSDANRVNSPGPLSTKLTSLEFHQTEQEHFLNPSEPANPRSYIADDVLKIWLGAFEVADQSFVGLMKPFSFLEMETTGSHTGRVTDSRLCSKIPQLLPPSIIRHPFWRKRWAESECRLLWSAWGEN